MVSIFSHFQTDDLGNGLIIKIEKSGFNLFIMFIFFYFVSLGALRGRIKLPIINEKTIPG